VVIILFNRVVKGTVSLVTGLIILGGSGAISANAASWHKGTPTSLQGKWRTNWQHVGHGKKRVLTKITKKNVTSIEQAYHGPSDMTRPTATSAKYKYLGHHTYQITGKLLSTTYTFKAKWYSHNKIKISDHYETHYWYRY